MAGRSLSGRRPARELGPDDDPVEVARQVCLDQLSFAPRTRAELAAACARRGVPPAVVDAVLDRFGEVGLVDDAAFAQAWVDRRSAAKGLGRRALSQELRRRGVDDTTAAGAVGALTDEAELAGARELVARKLRATASLPPEVRVRRLVGMLARKGHPSGAAYRVVREALAAEGTDVVLDTDGLSALD